MNGHRYSPVLVVALGAASMFACAAMGAALAGLIYDRLTGREPR